MLHAFTRVHSAFCTTSRQPQGCTQLLVTRAQIWQSRRRVHRVYKPQHCPTLRPNALTASSMRHPSAKEKAAGHDPSKLLVFHIFFSLRQMTFRWSRQIIQKTNMCQDSPAWQKWLTFCATAASPVGVHYRHVHHL